MKKFLSLLLVLAMLFSFASCINSAKEKETSGNDDTTVTTTDGDTTKPDTTVPDTTLPDTTLPDTSEPDNSDSNTSVEESDEITTTEPDVSDDVTTTEPTTTPEETAPPVTTDPPARDVNVTFSIDGATYSTAIAKGGSSITLPASPTKTGHTFVGWYYDKAGTKTFTADTVKKTPLKANTTVYGKWQLTEYTASFYADGVLVDSVKFVYTDKTVENAPKVPEKEGYLGFWNDYSVSARDISVNAIYAKAVMVRIVLDNENALSVEGSKVQTLNAANPNYIPVKINAKTGYKVSHYTVGGKRYEGDTVNITELSSDMTVRVYADYFTDELPIINIDTDGAPILNKEDYVEMVFDLENCDSELSKVTGGIRLRGNSTLGFPKKPYRIKFDKKQSLFGLPKAKSWVLLAEYIDPSHLHNHAALTLGNEMPGLSFTPSPNKVNVYLNGEYQGVYTLCEQVQENEGRIGIELEEITSDMTFEDINWFVCLDRNAKTDPGALLNETYIEIPIEGNHYSDYLWFEIKYPEKDAFPTEAHFNEFISDLREYLVTLVNYFDTKNVAMLKKNINVNSLVDYVIIDEIMGQEDHDKWHKSFNFYYTNTSDNPDEKGKVTFGPIWDYDWALHTYWTGKPNIEYNLTDKIEYFGPFYDVVFEVDEFYNILKTRYKTYAKPALQKYLDGYEELSSSMSESLKADASLWYTSYPSDITDKNVRFLKDFLKYRMNVLNEAWK